MRAILKRRLPLDTPSEWGKKTSWKQGGLIPHKVAMMIKAEEKVEKKRKRAPRKTAEEFFVEAFVVRSCGRRSRPHLLDCHLPASPCTQ